jgi:hypothetical protein
MCEVEVQRSFTGVSPEVEVLEGRYGDIYSRRPGINKVAFDYEEGESR